MANIGIDFDGSCVTHEYPNIGKDIGAIPVLKELVANGHFLILNTMRFHKEYYDMNDGFPDTLNDAVRWFDNNHVDLYGINRNPTQHTWTTSPKVYADYYIDDAAIGCPLKIDKSYSHKPFIDWVVMRELLVKAGLIKIIK